MKKLIAFPLCLVLLTSLTIDATAAVKAGTPCKKLGQTSTSAGKKFTCVKTGKKMVWKSGITISTSSPKPTVPEISTSTSSPNTDDGKMNLIGWCKLDSQVPDEWRNVQEWSARNLHCARAYRYVAGLKPQRIMKTKLISGNQLEVSQCKLDDSIGRPFAWANFKNSSQLYRPTKSAITQVIPFQFLDLTTSSNPRSDYDKYIKFYEDFLRNSSDVTINPKFRVPNEYFQLGFSYRKYHLNDHMAQDLEFIADISSVVTNKIDLSDVDQVLFLYPPAAKSAEFAAKIPFGNLSKTIFSGKFVYLHGPIDSSDITIGDRWSIDPWTTVHEMFGHIMGLDDHWGAELFAKSGPYLAPKDWRDVGTGQWGNMTGISGDFLIWDKWTVGWVADTQIRCLSPNSQSTILISPNTTKSNLIKAVVIPLSGSKGIVIESQRSTGYNFKFPTDSNGALVYVIDMKEISGGNGRPFGYGVNVQRPTNRPANLLQNGFYLGDATLKQGESINVEGVKISVVEAGDFGDVVQIG